MKWYLAGAVPALWLALAAQTMPEPPAFEVVSIKPTAGQPANSGFRRAASGALNATDVTPRFLIEFAYDLREDQVAGGPAWIDAERYEVVAKPPDGSDPREAAKLLRARTQALLADRFHLVAHREAREMPVLFLTVAKNGAKGLQQATAAAPDFVSNGHHLTCQRISMAVFAKDFLAHQMEHSVIDHTGIEGEFDFTLDWAPDDAPAQQFPPFVAALEEQLGLKLERGKGPVEVLSIERVERPSAN